ncbi:LytR/AlgR family response regulator transcription factor [Porcipelethomonas sp.]|uniref:LytR/AlgR family response regulator transcription factor n=1 Tax=Porcipelethomonas sp. TaxID=2981675 RepID=UPI003EF1C595
MIRMAVADDDEAICDELKQFINKFEIKYGYNIQCDIFTSCEALEKAMDNGTDYKLLFLDIEFPGMDGIELSKKIRNYYKNMKMQIIFISFKTDYAMELFDIQPFNFLIKPLKEEKVYSCLTKYMIYYNQTYQFFEYTYENMRHRIALNEIIYFESDGKKMIMHTIDNNIAFYGVFASVAEKLRSQFVVVKRGVLVNIQHIIKISFTYIELSDKSVIEISRSYRNEVRDRLALQ